MEIPTGKEQPATSVIQAHAIINAKSHALPSLKTHALTQYKHQHYFDRFFKANDRTPASIDKKCMELWISSENMGGLKRLYRYYPENKLIPKLDQMIEQLNSSHFDESRRIRNQLFIDVIQHELPESGLVEQLPEKMINSLSKAFASECAYGYLCLHFEHLTLPKLIDEYKNKILNYLNEKIEFVDYGLRYYTPLNIKMSQPEHLLPRYLMSSINENWYDYRTDIDIIRDNLTWRQWLEEAEGRTFLYSVQSLLQSHDIQFDNSQFEKLLNQCLLDFEKKEYYNNLFEAKERWNTWEMGPEQKRKEYQKIKAKICTDFAFSSKPGKTSQLD